jgi:hypothetical protein
MDAEEYGRPLWRAGEMVPAGSYLRVDDRSYRVVVLEQAGPLPASCDGHVAWYCQAPVAQMSEPPASVFVGKAEEPGESAI